MVALQSATFNTNEVTLFLAKRFQYAAQCFAQETLKYGDTIPLMVVSNWFQKYFPSPTNYNIFRELEASVTQHISFKH
jgi:hypothetical protein